MVSESETEEEILFDTRSKKKTKNNNLTKYGPNAQLINPAKLQWIVPFLAQLNCYHLQRYILY